MSCPICHSASTIIKEHLVNDSIVVECNTCGDFAITGSANAEIQSISDTDRWRVSAWLNQYNTETLNSDDIANALIAIVPSIYQRADRMLRYLLTRCPAGSSFYLPSLAKEKLIPIGWNRNSEEATYMVHAVLCEEMGLLNRNSRYTSEYLISPKGLLYLEGRQKEQSSLGFCAMWFSDEVKPLWTDAIEPAIRAAGYEPLRIDGKQHNGKIDDEIMASIRSSKFVVSDFTGSRGGVYYEAGFAHGLGLPVIFMCRENNLKDIHFDVRQYNCILWTPEKLEEAQSQLKNRILATLGQGPKLVQ